MICIILINFAYTFLKHSLDVYYLFHLMHLHEMPRFTPHINAELPYPCMQTTVMNLTFYIMNMNICITHFLIRIDTN